MANVGVVTNADQAANAAKPVQRVLPLERRVGAADCPEPAGGAGAATQIAAEGADAWAALTAFFHPPVLGQRSRGQGKPAGEEQGAPNVDGMGARGKIEQQEQPDIECASAAGLIPVPGSGLPSTAGAQDGVCSTGGDGPGPTDLRAPSDSKAGVEAYADDVVEVRASLSALAGTTPDRFEVRTLESPHERQTVLTQFSHDGPDGAADGDTLRFTYQFRSWQGQPAAMVSLNFHDPGRKLRVEAPDRAVYSALLANRDALAGTLKVVDDGPDSRGRDRGQREPGE